MSSVMKSMTRTGIVLGPGPPARGDSADRSCGGPQVYVLFIAVWASWHRWRLEAPRPCVPRAGVTGHTAQ